MIEPIQLVIEPIQFAIEPIQFAIEPIGCVEERSGFSIERVAHAQKRIRFSIERIDDAMRFSKNRSRPDAYRIGSATNRCGPGATASRLEVQALDRRISAHEPAMTA